MAYEHCRPLVITGPRRFGGAHREEQRQANQQDDLKDYEHWDGLGYPVFKGLFLLSISLALLLSTVLIFSTATGS